MTDGRGDVLANLRENIELNGLGRRAKVMQLAWGGRECETRELPVGIRNQSPFKVRYSPFLMLSTSDNKLDNKLDSGMHIGELYHRSTIVRGEKSTLQSV